MTSCLPSGSGFIREEACVVKEGLRSTSMCVGGGGGHFLHSAVLLLHARGMVLRRSNYKCAYMYTSVCCEFFYMCPECACSCTILEP